MRILFSIRKKPALATRVYHRAAGRILQLPPHRGEVLLCDSLRRSRKVNLSTVITPEFDSQSKNIVTLVDDVDHAHQRRSWPGIRIVLRSLLFEDHGFSRLVGGKQLI